MRNMVQHGESGVPSLVGVESVGKQEQEVLRNASEIEDEKIRKKRKGCGV